MMTSIERIRELGETAAEEAVEKYASVEAAFLCGKTTDHSSYWWAVVLVRGTAEKTYSFPLRALMFSVKDTTVVSLFKSAIAEALRDFINARHD